MLQLPEGWPGPAGPMSSIAPEDTSTQCEDNNTVKYQLWTGACHHQSALPKETGSHEQSKTKRSTIKQGNIIPATIPLTITMISAFGEDLWGVEVLDVSSVVKKMGRGIFVTSISVSNFLKTLYN